MHIRFDPGGMLQNKANHSKYLCSSARCILRFYFAKATIDNEPKIIIAEESALRLLVNHQLGNRLQSFVEAVHTATNRQLQKLLLVCLLFIEEFFKNEVVLRLDLFIVREQDCENRDKSISGALINDELQ